MKDSKQEIFDRVATHLARQKEVSRRADAPGCLYRSDSGLRCAIGCLLPDEVIDDGSFIARYNGTAVCDLPDHILKMSGLIGFEYGFLMGLQRVHDLTFESTDGMEVSGQDHLKELWCRGLRKFADRWELKFSQDEFRKMFDEKSE